MITPIEPGDENMDRDIKWKYSVQQKVCVAV